MLDDKFEELDPQELILQALYAGYLQEGFSSGKSDNSVLVLEIGGAVFKTARQRLFDALLISTIVTVFWFLLSCWSTVCRKFGAGLLLVSELSRCPVDSDGF